MNKYIRYIRDTTIVAIGILVAYHTAINYGISIGKVSGSSMEPTFHDMDTVLIKHYKLLYRNPIKGECVVIWNYKENDYHFKRIAAVPGDIVETIDTHKQYHLGKDQYIVLGDNTKDSYDSRYYGPIHRIQILGIVDEK